MTTTDTRIELKARAKAFTGQGVRWHKFYVDLNDKSVRVWDTIAGHYVLCHALSHAAKTRILKLAINLEN